MVEAEQGSRGAAPQRGQAPSPAAVVAFILDGVIEAEEENDRVGCRRGGDRRIEAARVVGSDSAALVVGHLRAGQPRLRAQKRRVRLDKHIVAVVVGAAKVCEHGYGFRSAGLRVSRTGHGGRQGTAASARAFLRDRAASARACGDRGPARHR